MTKDEAIKAMKFGAKVTHRYFTDGEWITMEDNQTIITEEGYTISAALFWKDRTCKTFDTDWSIWGNKEIG